MVNGTLLKPNSELSAMAGARLQGNWGKSILICFIFALLISVGGSTKHLFGSIVNLVITGPLIFGLYKYFMQFSKGEEPPVEVLFDGIKVFVTSLVLYLLMTIFTVLWSLLLIVPGIIAALSYSMSFYILNDNPQLTAMEAINKSKEMMDGQKGKLFMFSLSFLGWFLLSILTLGIGLLWLIPYYQTAKANFYEDLKNATA